MQSLVEQPHGDACERRQNVDGRDTTNGCRWFHISQSTCVTALARERLTKEQERNTHDPRSRRRGCRERWAGKDASKRPYYMIHTPYPIFTPKRYSAAIPHITKAAVQHDRKPEYKNSPQRKIDLPTSPESSKSENKMTRTHPQPCALNFSLRVAPRCSTKGETVHDANACTHRPSCISRTRTARSDTPNKDKVLSLFFLSLLACAFVRRPNTYTEDE
jgi:hypothetical protein